MIADLFLLDSGPVGLITNPRESPFAAACKGWFRSALAAGSRVMVPEVVDDEVRRELIRAGKTKGIGRLDTLVKAAGALPVDARVWRKAAESGPRPGIPADRPPRMRPWTAT